MGSLGLWYPANEKVLSALQIGWKYVTLSVWSPPLLALRLYYMYTEERRTSHSGVTTRTCTCTIKSLHYTSLTAFATQLYSPFDMSHKLSCGEIGMSNHLFKSYHYQLSVLINSFTGIGAILRRNDQLPVGKFTHTSHKHIPIHATYTTCYTCTHTAVYTHMHTLLVRARTPFLCKYKFTHTSHKHIPIHATYYLYTYTPVYAHKTYSKQTCAYTTNGLSQTHTCNLYDSHTHSYKAYTCMTVCKHMHTSHTHNGLLVFF